MAAKASGKKKKLGLEGWKQLCKSLVHNPQYCSECSFVLWAAQRKHESYELWLISVWLKKPQSCQKQEGEVVGWGSSDSCVILTQLCYFLVGFRWWNSLVWGRKNDRNVTTDCSHSCPHIQCLWANISGHHFEGCGQKKCWDKGLSGVYNN